MGAQVLGDDRDVCALRYRLVATDVDGTLLDERGELTIAVRRAIRATQAAGAVVCLATSRRLTGAAPVAEALAIEGPLILYDGAQVRCFPSRDIVMSRPLPAEVGQDAVDILAEHGLQPIVQYADHEGERLVAGPAQAASMHSEVYLTTFAHQIVELPVHALCADRPDPLRVVAFGPQEVLNRAVAAIAHLPCGVQLLKRGSYGTSELSVFAQGASKGRALLWLAQYLGVARAHTLAVGDGVNDVSMLRVAGLGVAMGNADHATKAAASVVTSSNEEDGVARMLNRFVLDAPGEW